jgi:hypothetical protein
MPTACPAKTWLKLIFFVAETDAATAGDHDGFVVEGIVDVRQPGVGTRGRLVDLRRTFHIQSFVRALVVEELKEFIEASLLLQKVGAAGLVASFFKVRCMRSGRPFCCGAPGLMLSIPVPRRSRQTAKFVRQHF